jgi:hypothetical protein
MIHHLDFFYLDAAKIVANMSVDEPIRGRVWIVKDFCDTLYYIVIIFQRIQYLIRS